MYRLLLAIRPDYIKFYVKKIDTNLYFCVDHNKTYKMDGGGFEPPKQFAADLQSVPFGHSGSHPYSLRTDSIIIPIEISGRLSVKV